MQISLQMLKKVHGDIWRQQQLVAIWELHSSSACLEVIHVIRIVCD